MKTRASCVVRHRRLRAAGCGLRKSRILPMCIVAYLSASSAGAQATAYVPLDDPVYAYVAAIQARGGLRGLWALERPHTVTEIANALFADTTAIKHPDWHFAILTALGRHEPAMEQRGRASTVEFRATFGEAPELRAAMAFDAFITAQTTGRRELMLAGDGDGGIHPGLAARFMAGSGNVVAVGRLIGDTRLRKDPEFAGRKDRAIVGRSEDGYILASNRFGQLALGRLGRDWGPPHLGGLQIGAAPATYDQLYARLGGSRLRLSAMVARLSDYVAGDTVAQRFVAAHRLALRLGAFEIAGTETMVYGGEGESVVPALTNPLIVFDAAQYNENATGNVQVGLDILFRSHRLGAYGVQLMLDDLQIDECDPNCNEPKSWGATLTAEGIPLLAEHRAFASYTRLTNLAYRTSSSFETYSHLGIGLGRAFTDYDEVRAGVETSFMSIPVRAYWARRRQGEGDYRIPFPTPSQYAATPEFLAGVVTVVNRYAVRGSGIFSFADLEGDVGYNVVRNADNVAGRKGDGFEGRVRVSIRPRWLWRLNEGGS